jgi:PAS domain S-box-containing protein
MIGEIAQRFRVLIVEDQAVLAADMSDLLRQAGYEVVGVSATGEAAIKLALEASPDLILVDIELRGAMDGIEAAKTIRSYRDAATIYITAHSERAIFERAMQTGPDAFLYKPVSPMELTRTVEMVLHKRLMEKRLKESEERYRTLVETMNEGLVIVDRAGVVLFVNDRMCELMGYGRAELVGNQAISFFDEKNQETLRRELSQSSSGINMAGFEITVTAKGGGKVPLIASITALRDSRGAYKGSFGVVADITERKRAEEILRQSERRFRDLVELLPHFVFELDLNANIVFMNRGGLEGIGYTQEDIEKGLNVIEVIDQSDRDRIMLNFSKILQGERSHGNQYMMVRKDGAKAPIISYSVPILSEGRPIGVRGVAVDISEIRDAHEALRESEEKYRSLFENAGDAILILEADGEDAGKIVRANRAAAEMHGYSLDEIVGLNISDLDAPEEIRIIPERIRRIQTGEWIKDEIHHRRKDGTIFPVEITAGLLSFRDHSYILAIDRDISARRRAEEAIRASELKYRTILETIADGYHEVDLQGALMLANDSLCKILGYPREELLGRSFRQLMDAENAQKVIGAYNQVLRTGEPNPEFTFEIVRKDGARRWASISIALVRDANGRPVGFHGVLRDITARRKVGGPASSEEDGQDR